MIFLFHSQCFYLETIGDVIILYAKGVESIIHATKPIHYISSNRQVSQKNKKFVRVKDLEIPEEGLLVYLKEFGIVKVFKKMFKNEYRYYAIWLSNSEELNEINTETFNSIHDKYWGIEQYHRALKQLCNIERFQVRKTEGIKTHIFSSIVSFIQLELARFNSEIINWYDLKRNMFNEIIRFFIMNHLPA
ncbi:hypothetical protein [Geminocystis sp. NIES-3709]|uniref:hypothetical protein n=1 Tax=Geminocystis sp. NIES-3709 TaxID=1617448 RepID=UPI0005FC6CD1|nr:hypothetical protein [Geminocystis sp. NIES-3709]BAQ65838.1 hypothetical protein GM3709_2603 [Geminocystis sp. NIES-3709]